MVLSVSWPPRSTDQDGIQSLVELQVTWIQGCHWRPQHKMGQLQTVQQVPTQSSTWKCHWYSDSIRPHGPKRNPRDANLWFSQLRKWRQKRQRQWRISKIIVKKWFVQYQWRRRPSNKKLHLATQLCALWINYQERPTVQCRKGLFKLAHIVINVYWL